MKIDFLNSMTKFIKSCKTTLIEDELEQDLHCTENGVTIPVDPYSIETFIIVSE